MFKEKDFTKYDWQALLAAKNATEKALRGLLAKNKGFDSKEITDQALSTQKKTFNRFLENMITRLNDIDHEIDWRKKNGKAASERGI